MSLRVREYCTFRCPHARVFDSYFSVLPTDQLYPLKTSFHSLIGTERTEIGILYIVKWFNLKGNIFSEKKKIEWMTYCYMHGSETVSPGQGATRAHASHRNRKNVHWFLFLGRKPISIKEPRQKLLPQNGIHMNILDSIWSWVVWRMAGYRIPNLNEYIWLEKNPVRSQLNLMRKIWIWM